MFSLEARTIPALLGTICAASALACSGSRAPDAEPAPHAAPAAPASSTSASASARPSPAALRADSLAMVRARADSARHPYTQGDVDFMEGMIQHHGQAIVMAGWAPSHRAAPSVRILAERIVNAQQDEIATARQWLLDRRRPAPMPDTSGAAVVHHASMHAMRMPGMLSPGQLQQLQKAGGPDFDRLFLTFMIQHHRGAVAMVKQLFDTYGAGQDDLVFKFASDVNVDQTTEIARMQRMLAALPPAHP